MNDTKINEWETIRFQGLESTRIEEVVASEFPLTIYINGEEFATMVCSPVDLNDLIIGFLASEGIIRFYDEIISITVDENKGFAYVELNRKLDSLSMDHSKRVIGSCCGKSRQFYYKSDVRTAKTITSDIKISVDQSYLLMELLQRQSNDFIRTGGVHNAALATDDGLLMIKTDIGRHNALDKLYGQILSEKIRVSDKVIVFSGRISSEVLLKVSKIGVGIIISKSAPTDLALKLAHDLGVTVIGFVRGHKLNVYTHSFRIIDTVTS